MSLLDIIKGNQYALFTREHYIRRLHSRFIFKLVKTGHDELGVDLGISDVKLWKNKILCATIRHFELLLMEPNNNSSYSIKTSCHIPSHNFHISFDIQDHIFIVAAYKEDLYVGDPNRFEIIDDIKHPIAVSNQHISKVNPFEVAAGGIDGKVYISDLRIGSNVLTVNRDNSKHKLLIHSKINLDLCRHHCVAWAPSSERLMCSAYSSCPSVNPLVLLDIRSPKRSFQSHFNCAYSSQYPPPIAYLDFKNNYIVSVVQDTHVRVWDPWTGNLIQIITRLPVKMIEQIQPVLLDYMPEPLIFVPDSHCIRLFEVNTNSFVHLFDGHFGNYNLLKFDRRNFRLISFSEENSLSTWNLVSKN